MIFVTRIESSPLPLRQERDSGVRLNDFARELAMLRVGRITRAVFMFPAVSDRR
jgi:hypothetical protein